MTDSAFELNEGPTHTLSSDNEAGHTVRDTGASCQKSDAHEDVWDSKCVADYGHLVRIEVVCVCFYVCVCMSASLPVCFVPSRP